jgi:hypothetical protein
MMTWLEQRRPGDSANEGVTSCHKSLLPAFHVMQALRRED